MLAALCLSLKIKMKNLKDCRKLEFGLNEKNCLGSAILIDDSFFTNFAFNYQGINKGCRNTLERIYRNAASQSFEKGLKLIEFIWKEHIDKVDEKVLELMKIFKVESV